MAAVLARAAEEAQGGDLGACEWLQNDGLLYAGLARIDDRAVFKMAEAWQLKPAGKSVICLKLEGN